MSTKQVTRKKFTILFDVTALPEFPVKFTRTQFQKFLNENDNRVGRNLVHAGKRQKFDRFTSA